MAEKSTVKMIVDRQNLSIRFECEGSIWDWIKQKKIDQWVLSNRVMGWVQEKEVKTFCYEMYLNKFIKQYSENLKVVEI